MRMKRIIISAAALLLLLTNLYAKDFRIEIGGGYFYPSETAFREIYGQGFIIGLDIGKKIWKNMEFHLEASYFTKKGELTFTRETTRIKILPIGSHLRYIFLKKILHLYAGAGLTYALFEEKNPIGRVRENKLGYKIKIGGFKRIKGFKKILKQFIIDVQMNYHYCKMKPAEIRFNAGGFDLGIYFGFEF